MNNVSLAREVLAAPKVSIITPAHNSEFFLRQTIESVLSQTFTNWQLIVIDDCSTDSTVEIVEEYCKKDERVKLIKCAQNGGAAVARNIGIEAAIGQYIAFLDADDVWRPNKLECQVSWMEKEDWAFTFTAYEKMAEDGNTIGIIGVPPVVGYRTILKGNVIGCLTAMYDTKKLGKVYMPLIRKRQDWGLWLKILKETQYGYGLSEPLAKYRIRTDSLSSNKKDAARYSWRLMREIEGLSRLRATYCFLHYAFRGFLRSYFPDLARRLGVLW